MAVPAQSSPEPKTAKESELLSLTRAAGILVLVGTVPLALFTAAGPKIIWGMVVAAVPLGIVLAGYHVWRRVCPLAFFATLGQRVGLQRKKKVGDWLAAHGLEMQTGLLVAALVWRHLGANSTPWALAVLFLLVILGAMAVGFLYTGKTWCNHLCPVGVIEKLYQEPVLLLPQEGNSQCTACTACKKNCPDIDLEQAYWKELEAPARRRVYYSWPGLVLGFFCYFPLANGTWSHYLEGTWSQDPLLATRMLAPGFHFAPALPRLAAVPLTILTFGLGSYLFFTLLERFLGPMGESASPTLRHRCLSLAGFTGFILFYAFTGQAALAPLPTWARYAITLAIMMVATALLLARWQRNETSFIQEKFAKGLLKRWEWGDAPPSDRLSDLYVLHQERVQQREARLKTYKSTVRDLLAEGVLNRGNLIMLNKLRGELGIGDKDHDKLLSELSLEEKQLFDPDYQGSLEKELQLRQYRAELEALLLGGRPADSGAVESLRQLHRIQSGEHLKVLDELRGEHGPLVARLQEAVDATLQLHRAVLASEQLGGEADDGNRGHRAFFRHVARWRQRQRLEHIIQLLDLGLPEPRLQTLRLTLASAGSHGIQELMEMLGAMADQGALGATLTPFVASGEPPRDPGLALRSLTQDPSRFVRASALTLLAELRDEASDQTLRWALTDPEPLVRTTALGLLGVSEDLTEPLSDLAADEEQWLLRAAVQALPPGGETRMTQSPLQTLILLHGVPLFAQLDPDDLETLAMATTVRIFGAGQSLCRQGDRSDEVFLLTGGRVRTSIPDGEGQPRSLGDSSAGACIGEMAVLDPAPRAATVTALTEVSTLVLDGPTFRDVLYTHPAVAEGVLRVLTQRLRSLIQGPSAE